MKGTQRLHNSNNKNANTQRRPNSTKTSRKQSFPILLHNHNNNTNNNITYSNMKPYYDMSTTSSSTRPYHDPNATYIPKPSIETLSSQITSLKETINTLKQEITTLKSKNQKLTLTLSKRDHQIDTLAYTSSHPSAKSISTLNKLKRDYQHLLTLLNERDSEISSLKMNITLCSSNEYKIQNEILMNELHKLTTLYESSQRLNKTNNDININNNILKAELTTQHGIILNINEQLEQTLKENKILKKCCDDMKHKSLQYENNAKFLKAENEKLQKKLNRVIKEHVEIEDWKNEKQRLMSTIDKLNKDVLHYQCQQMKDKDKQMAVSKREEEAKKANEDIQKQKSNMNAVMVPLYNIQRKGGITTSTSQQQQQHMEHPDVNVNQQVLLLKSIITELQQENKQLKQKNVFYEKQTQQQSSMLVYDDDNDNDDINNEHIRSKFANQSNNKVSSSSTTKSFTLSFQDILTFNAEHKSLNEQSIQQLCSFIFSQYANNMEADNDDDTKNTIIELMTNTLALSLNCNTSSQSKSELMQFLIQLYDSDDDDSFKENFYNIFHNINTHSTENDVERDNEMKGKIINVLKKKQNVVDNVIECFPSEINVNVLNELLHKNGVVFTKKEFLALCYYIKGDDVVHLNEVSTKELKTFIENN